MFQFRKQQIKRSQTNLGKKLMHVFDGKYSQFISSKSELPDTQASSEKKKKKKSKKTKQAEQPYLLTPFLSATPHTHHEFDFSVSHDYTM